MYFNSLFSLSSSFIISSLSSSRTDIASPTNLGAFDRLQSPYILRTYGSRFSSDHTSLQILMEYSPNGSLRDYIRVCCIVVFFHVTDFSIPQSLQASPLSIKESFVWRVLITIALALSGFIFSSLPSKSSTPFLLCA